MSESRIPIRPREGYNSHVIPGGLVVGRVAVAILLGSFAVLSLVSNLGRASLYTPDEPLAIPVGADGKGQALPYDAFRLRYAEVLNVPNDAKKDGKFNSDRQKVLNRIDLRQGKKLTVVETAAQAADLLRVGRADQALNLIKPRALDRNPNYFALTTLAHIHAARGEWQQAVDNQVAALLDSEMPAEVKGLTKPQRDWIAKIDRDYVLPYFQFHLKEANTRPAPNQIDEDVYPLFPVAERNKPHQPVRFANDAGVYQPGNLAASERAKLPPDAIAVVQQLLLWFPHDNRLYWLLAELYSAEGQLTPARTIMDGLVSEDRKYSNRKILMEHRHLTRAADDAQPKATAPEDVVLVQPAAESNVPPPPTPEEQISMRTILIYFGVIGVIAAFAFVRAMSRRVRGECGPVG